MKNKGISRRDFLRGSAASALGLATAGLLGACSNAAAETTAETTVAAVESTGAATAAATEATTEAMQQPVSATTIADGDVSKYEVINTDILIIGTGFGGMSAAYEAVAKGRQVTMIDKGSFRHAGAAGFNWDVIATWCPDEEFYGQETYVKKILNQQALYNADTTNPNADLGTVLLNRGQVSPVRNEDGSIKWYGDFPFMRGMEAYFPRHDQDQLVKSAAVTVIDRTMITDLLISDGKCCGAMGIYLPTGDFRVYRANATILATGGTTWMYGWSTISAHTFNSPDNTGDVDIAAYRHGAGIGDSEYGAYDICTIYPEGLAYGWGTILNADANEHEMIMDRDGKRLFTEEEYDLSRFEAGDRAYFNQELAKKITQGYGTDNGGVLVDVSDAPLRDAMRRNVAIFEKFGIDVTKTLMEAAPEMYEHGGTPVIDDNLMSEDLPGLFCVRGSGTAGMNGGSCVTLLHRFGSYAVRCAIDYIEANEALATMDWSSADTEYERLHEIRTRKVDQGIRPHVVRHNIQRACGECLGVYRTKEAMEAALTELRRIRTEEIPNMIVTNPTLTYNTEWKEAIENYNLLTVAELSVQASLLREETRGAYLRADFPEQDDENWACTLVGRLKDGEMTFEKKVWPVIEEWA